MSTSYRFGSAIGLAALTAVGAAFTGVTGDAVALTFGFSAAFAGASAVAFVGAVIAAIALRQPKVSAPELATSGGALSSRKTAWGPSTEGPPRSPII